MPATAFRLVLCVIGVSACAQDATSPKESGPPPALIAFSVRYPTSDSMPIYVVRSDGTEPHRIASGPGTRYGLTWAPDRLRLAYIYSPTGNLNQTELHIVNADGSNDHRVLGLSRIFSPAWAPDGSRILLSRQDSTGQAQLMTVDTTGAQLWPLTSRAADDLIAAWSPDGARLAVISNCRGAPPCNPSVSDLWVMNIDGTNAQQLTFGTAIDDDAGAPTWSPDGSWITFHMSRRDTTGLPATNLYRVRPAGGATQQLTFGDWQTASLNPSYSPDGSALLYTTWTGPDAVNTPLFVARADGTSPRSLGLTVGEPVSATWAR